MGIHFHDIETLPNQAIVTRYMKYSVPIGRDCVYCAPLETKFKNREPKYCLSVVTHLLRKWGTLETR